MNMTTTQIPLGSYHGLLPSVDVNLGCRTVPFLFDTGAGMTCLTPRTAAALSCIPSGRGTGFRKSGERIDAPRCDGASLQFAGEHTVRTDCLVMDLMALLPPEWPELGGALALNTFEGTAVRIHHGTSLEISEASALIEAGGFKQGHARHTRQVGGLSLGVSVAVEASGVTLWFVLDSGNTGPTIVAPHAADLLGFETDPTVSRQSLRLKGIGQIDCDIVVQEMIYDGLIGFPAIKDWDVVLDLDRPRFWLKQ